MAEEERNGIYARVRVLEVGQSNLNQALRDLQRGDLKDIRTELRQLREEDIVHLRNEFSKDVLDLRGDFAASRQGLSRGEKIMLGGVGASLVTAVVAVAALITAAPA